MNELPHKHQGESHEDHHGQSVSDPADSLFSDGYSGPRARMVLGEHDNGGGGTDASGSAHSRIGVFERGLNAFIALLVMIAIIISVCIVPFVLTAYFIYTGLKKMKSLLFGRRNPSRFVILGTEGSYMIKDIDSREFVAKHIPNMRAAKKILRIFTSNTVQTRNT